MAYETKVLLLALARIVKGAKDLEEVYDAIQEMANAESVVLAPYHDDAKRDDK